MTCRHCARARDLHAYPLASAGCRGCDLRALANSHWFRWSQADGVQLQGYRDALASAGATHAEVKAWMNSGREEFTV